jgi:hypothetical protein
MPEVRPVEPGASGVDLGPPVTAASAPEVLFRDDLERGGAIGLLHGLLQEPLPIGRQRARDGSFAIARDAETFGRIFEPRATAPALRGLPEDLRLVPDGTTIDLPEGTFGVSSGALMDTRRRRDLPFRFPRDVVFKGAGMDRTLLRGGLHYLTCGEVLGLTFVDVTLDCKNPGVLHLKSGIATLRLVRCRVRAGTVVAADAAALHAAGCEFDDTAELLRAERGLARLDQCTIRGAIDAGPDGSDVACVFHRCAFLDAPPHLQTNLEQRRAVLLEGCRFEVAAKPPPPRPLYAINPAWRD